MNLPPLVSSTSMNTAACVRALSRWALTAAIVAGAFAVVACDSPTEPTTSPAASSDRSHRVVAEADDPCAYAFGQQTPPPTAGGSFTVSLTSLCLWTAASDQPWLTTSSRSSTWSGNDQVAYVVAANPTTATRTGTITVTGGGSSAQLFVVQPGIVPCSLGLGPATQNVSGAGGNLTTALTASCAWTASTDSPWLDITNGASGSGNATIAYTVGPNISNATRTGHITIVGGASTAQLTVIQTAQAAPQCSFTLSSTAFTVPPQGATLTVGITAPAGCAWTATSNAQFITVTSGASGSGNGNVVFAVASNPDTVQVRTGTLTIAGQTVTVTQNVFCGYTVAPTSANVPAIENTARITVTTPSTCTWAAASNSAFIAVISGANGTGNGTVTLTVGANASVFPRTGTVTVAGQTVTINQAANPGTGDLSATLTWDTGTSFDPVDIDIHVFEPSGVEVFHGNPKGPTATLDTNNKIGRGPETISVGPGAAQAGTYRIFIEYFNGFDNPTNASIAVRVFANTSNEVNVTFARQFTFSNCFNTLFVADVTFPSGTITPNTSTGNPTDGGECNGGLTGTPIGGAARVRARQ